MFTGIIEEVGTVEGFSNSADICRITVRAPKIMEDTAIGDSIAVNGVCLTASFRSGDIFGADVMAETARRTNLVKLHRGSRVNLERAMTLNGRFGGHIVSGHVDGTGTVLSIKKEGNAYWYQIGAEAGILRYVIEKGSVAIDGISLTVARLEDQSFFVSIIPHTREETILFEKKPGSQVNLENDLIGKYVERLLEHPPKEKESVLTVDFLSQHGFL